MFIQTEQTPNPATLKFLPGKEVMVEGTADFRDAEAAARSPLAQRLFQVEGVEGVFLGSDFISVTKPEDKEWYLLKPAILGIIMEHFTAGRPVILEDQAGDEAEASEEDSEVVAQIKELLDTRVRPAVAQDGGDIVFRGFDQGIVMLTMQGACQGCPSSTATLKMGIENMLRHWAPTSMNRCPARFVFVTTPEAKERLRPALSEGNLDKTMAAPVTAIIAHDLKFFEKMEKLVPHNPKAGERFANGLPKPASAVRIRLRRLYSSAEPCWLPAHAPHRTRQSHRN